LQTPEIGVETAIRTWDRKMKRSGIHPFQKEIEMSFFRKLASGALVTLGILGMGVNLAWAGAGSFDEEKVVGNVLGLFAGKGGSSKTVSATSSSAASAAVNPRDASMTVLEAARRWDQMSDTSRASLKQYMLRPTSPGDTYYYGDPLVHPVQTLVTTHFTIHYSTDTTSKHIVSNPTLDAMSTDATFTSLSTAAANGVPDYVDKVAVAFEQAWYYFCNATSYGFTAPQADTDGSYDVYLLDLDNGIYGITFPETADPRISYIVMDNDYNEEEFTKSEDQLIMVTAVHEFFHALQYTMDPWEEKWFMEVSSTFIEDLFADDVNDYVQYLNSFFRNSYRSLTTFNGLHEYGSSLFMKFLSERFKDATDKTFTTGGRTLEVKMVLKRIWDLCKATGGENAIASLEAVLADTAAGYDSSLSRAYREFMIWCYFTGSMNPSGDFPVPTLTNTDVFADYSADVAYATLSHRPLGTVARHSFFEDDDASSTVSAVEYPGITIGQSVNSYPSLAKQPTASLPQYLGTTFLEFVPVNTTRKELKITFDGYDSAGWSVLAIKRKSNGGADFEQMTLNAASQAGEISVEEFGSQEKYVRVVLAISVIKQQAGMSRSYSYPFTFSATSGLSFDQATTIVDAYAYPNPSRNGISTVRFNLMRNADVTLRIYDVRGRLVTTLLDGENRDAAQYPTGHESVWQGVNDEGRRVANGVYFFKVQADSDGSPRSETTGKIVILR